MALKTKTTKIDELHPPREIREVTKARRAWLAEALAGVKAQPGRDGKIVGQGSYQYVSVYQIEETEARIQLRGTCQFCGEDQAVAPDADGGHRIVLHGYNRPGWGHVVGRCPAEGMLALEESDLAARKFLAESQESLIRLRALHVEAEAEHEKARKSWGTMTQAEITAGYAAAPKKTWGYRNPSVEEQHEYDQRRAAWAKQYPKHARLDRAEKAASSLRTSVWQMESQCDHFVRLVGSQRLGQPLYEKLI